MPTIRERIVEVARLFIGCGVTEQRERYVDLLMAPEDPPRMRDYYAGKKTSGCALVIAGFLRLMGLQSPVLRYYTMGFAMANLSTIARASNAVRERYDFPEPGDWVRVGGGSDGGGDEHVFLVEEVTKDKESACWKVRVIEGGQRDAEGNEIILESEHRWFYSFGVLWDEHGTIHRMVREIVNIEKLPFPDGEQEQDK
jgi:hypothetical protein